MATVVSVGFGSANAADVNLNNGWEAFPTPESRAAAIKLGKALFWDEQLGSGNGGQYACASCHYQAGADSNPLRIQAGRLDNGIFGSLGVTAANFQAVTCVDDPSAPGGLCAEPLDTFETVGALHITG
ncbi:MAG: cytochrome-c peroxidase, partial [Rubripirellula sp.]|nr:cytochrome-c peroxidase [Rubripirellula sp.]